MHSDAPPARLARGLLFATANSQYGTGVTMPFDIDTAFGNHTQALLLRARRAEVLAGNLANADTPNYKARDLDFRSVLGNAQDGALRLTETNAAHLAAGGTAQDPELLYRVPLQASLDGNTVDTQVEYAEFARNATQYQASLTFLNNRIKTLMTAIRGD
jgi:flagellar basal-body rod protein FlgB